MPHPLMWGHNYCNVDICMWNIFSVESQWNQLLLLLTKIISLIINFIVFLWNQKEDAVSYEWQQPNTPGYTVILLSIVSSFKKLVLVYPPLIMCSMLVQSHNKLKLVIIEVIKTQNLWPTDHLNLQLEQNYHAFSHGITSIQWEFRPAKGGWS